jgi:hypothetical protein
VSVQSCETYPPARGKNKQDFFLSAFACCMDEKHKQNPIFFPLSTKEILNKILTRLIECITKPSQQAHYVE